MNISFGSADVKNRIALKEKIDIDAYTGKKLRKNDKSIEHIQPASRNGMNDVSNYLVVHRKINEERGNTPFWEFLQDFPEVIKNIQSYLDRYRGMQFKGENYVEAVKATLNREAKGVVSFRGKNNG